ncbi:MAG: gliding motility-associated C-terminal domain-containing protein [Bacteroidota bacterium]
MKLADYINPKPQILLIATICLATNIVFSQSTLSGLLNNHLVSIDKNTADLNIEFEITSVPSGSSFDNLTYHDDLQKYFSVLDRSTSPTLAGISPTGELSVIGPITLNGNQIPLVEGLAFNPVQAKLYAAVSLNGGISNGDFYSETIVEVDPSNGACTFVTEINTSLNDPDIDVMVFNDNKLYIFDGLPPSVNELYFYELDFNNLSPISIPTEIYNQSYLAILGFTIIDNDIFFTENRNLRKFNLLTKTLSTVGQTHSSGEFAGQRIIGLSKPLLCTAPEVDLGVDLLLCDRNTFLLDATWPNSNYLWSNGSRNPTVEITETGEYWVEITNSCGVDRDTIRLEFINTPVVDLGNSRTICDESKVVLDAFFPNATYLWQDGSEMPKLEAVENGLYWVRIENECGISSDSIDIKFEAAPVVDLGAFRTVCDESQVVLDASFPNATYFWQDGSEMPKLEIVENGFYWVRGENDCGVASDSIELKFEVAPTVDLGASRTVCEEDQVLLDASIPEANYLWQDGSTDSIFIAQETGLYWTEVSNLCGSARDSIILTFEEPTVSLPNVITPNGDSKNQFFIVPDNLINKRLKIFNRNGKMVYESKQYQNNWDGNGLSSGTYYYSIKNTCGSTYKGWLSIIK